MFDRCLQLVRCTALPLERRRIHRLLDGLDARLEWQLATPDPLRAGQLLQQRRHLIMRFLEDPGYATPGLLRILHGAHPDVFPRGTYERYMAGPFERQQAFLRCESVGHVVVAGLFALLLVLGLIHAWVWAPALMMGLLWSWITLFLADAVWCTYLSAIARSLVLNVDTPRRDLFEALLDETVRGLHWWQKPAGALIAAIVKRIGPRPPAAAWDIPTFSS